MNSNAKDVALGFAGGLAVGTVIGGLLARRAGASSVPKLPQLTLHLYDHCPFCIRVELVLGWKGIPYERRVYGYGDTLGSTKGKYYGGTTLTGSKQLPVLAVHQL